MTGHWMGVVNPPACGSDVSVCYQTNYSHECVWSRTTDGWLEEGLLSNAVARRLAMLWGRCGLSSTFGVLVFGTWSLDADGF
jgi:hypothetical protein